MIRLFVICVMLFMMTMMIGGCQNAAPGSSSTGAQAVPTSTDNNAKIKVMADGRIFLNGVEASLEQVTQELQRLATVSGSVCYNREAPNSEPHPNAVAVIDAVIGANLPITLSETDCV